MSQLSTHVLDTSKGKPAEGITTTLFIQHSEDPVTLSWRQIAIGTTNDLGRIPDFIHKDMSLAAGNYRLRFETKEYYEKLALLSFYPYIEVTFTIADGENYHVPLLISPFGFSTYRGS